jgi:outer membrane cobalamin receptor
MKNTLSALLCDYRYSSKNITKPLMTSAVSLLALSVSAAIHADTPPEDVYPLGQIVVKENVETASNYRIDRTDMERISARSLDEAIRLVPSLNVRNGADGTPRIDIRGLRTRQIKLLVNGVPFNSTFDGQFDPTLIPTFGIGRIDLKAGGSSVLYGDGGMGGVMDIQTRGQFNGLRSGVKAELGSDHFWHSNAFAGYGDEDNDLFMAAGIRSRDGFPMSDDFDSPIGRESDNFQDTDERNNSDYRRENYLLSYNRQVTEKLNLGIFLSHLQGDYGQPPSAFLPGPGNNRIDPFANNPNYQRTEEQRGTTIQIGGDYAFNDSWGAKLWFFNNELEENELRFDDANYNSFIQRGSRNLDNETDIHGFHAQVDGVIASTNTEIGFSVDRRNEAFESEGIRCDASGGGGGGGGGSSTCDAASDFASIDIDEDIDIESYGVEIVQPLPYELTAIAGIAHHKLDKANGTDESEQSARFVLSKAFNPDTSVYGSFSRKVDSPTIRQLYDEEGGNETLGFQKANHLELGLNQRWDKIDLNLALYRTKVFDFIERNSDRVFESRQELTIEGVDLTAAIQATERLTVRAGLGLLNAKDESSDALSSTLQYRPKNKFTLDADYLINERWSIAANLIHIGSQAYFNRDDESEHKDLASYQLVATKLNYRLPGDSGQIYVGIENLLDEDYQTSYGFPQAGRFLYTGINLNWH